MHIPFIYALWADICGNEAIGISDEIFPNIDLLPLN
jgi:hypothetical protein